MNTSSAKERRALILRQLEQKEEIFVTELSRETGISEVTIRKDLTILQNRNLLIRTRGGAMRRPVENPNAETAITRKRMFNFEGDHIMRDSGTTTLEVARHLQKFHNLHILTNAINIATELIAYNRFDVILLGGNVHTNNHSTVGPLALSVLRNFTGYKLFLGVDSFSLEHGVSTPSLEEALINQLMIQQAIIQLKNGVRVATYASAREAERLTGFCFSGISHAARGRIRSFHGFEWRFA